MRRTIAFLASPQKSLSTAGEEELSHAGNSQVNEMQPLAQLLALGCAAEGRKKTADKNRRLFSRFRSAYSVDSISNPQASSNGSGIYFEFLLRRAHSRSRVERTYWSGVSLNSFTACSKDVTIGTTGPMGSGLPQFGLPRLFAIIKFVLPFRDIIAQNQPYSKLDSVRLPLDSMP